MDGLGIMNTIVSQSKFTSHNNVAFVAVCFSQ